MNTYSIKSQFKIELVLAWL